MKHLSSPLFFTLLCAAYSLQAATQQTGSLTFPPASESEALGLNKPLATPMPATSPAPASTPSTPKPAATALPLATPAPASNASPAALKPAPSSTPVATAPVAVPSAAYTQGMQFPPQANQPATLQYPSVQANQPMLQFPQTGYTPNAYPYAGYAYPPTTYAYSPYAYNYGANPYANSPSNYPAYGYRPYNYAYNSNAYNRLMPYALRPPVPQTAKKEKKAWGDVRNIWPDFYTEFSNDMWDKAINAPYDMGYMPGGWRFPSFSSPDPITISDAVANQVPPFARESGNMVPFNDMRNFSPF